MARRPSTAWSLPVSAFIPPHPSLPPAVPCTHIPVSLEAWASCHHSQAVPSAFRAPSSLPLLAKLYLTTHLPAVSVSRGVILILSSVCPLLSTSALIIYLSLSLSIILLASLSSVHGLAWSAWTSSWNYFFSWSFIYLCVLEYSCFTMSLVSPVQRSELALCIHIPPIWNLPPTLHFKGFKGFKSWTSVHMSSHVQLFASPWTGACQAPLSMGFPRWEYWSGLPFPSPGDLPDPGVELTSFVSPTLAGGFFTNCTTWEA